MYLSDFHPCTCTYLIFQSVRPELGLRATFIASTSASIVIVTIGLGQKPTSDKSEMILPRVPNRNIARNDDKNNFKLG